MTMAPQVALRANPALVASMQLLALPIPELESLIERELEANPALERVEQYSCPTCGAPLVGRWCLECAPARRPDQARPDRPLPAEESLAEALLRELRLQVAEREQPIAAYLVGSFDSRGFLDVGVDDVASALSVSPDEVIAVLTIIQRTGPPGVGSRDVRECLLIQLARTCSDHADYELARTIVMEHLAELAHGRYRSLASVLHVDRARVLAVRELIRTRLRPYPILPAPETWSRLAPIAMPEIVVQRNPGDAVSYEVEVLEQRRLAVAISPSYERIDPRALAAHERELVEAQLTSARSFAQRLSRRWETIRVVAEQLVQRQRDFVEHGPRALVPLTRREVAEELGLHESTVGRAVGGRHALLPSRRVVALSDFFDSAAGARDALADAVASEPRPLSDTDLARLLARIGYCISRRTVAKYRSQLGIPASGQR